MTGHPKLSPKGPLWEGPDSEAPPTDAAEDHVGDADDWTAGSDNSGYGPNALPGLEIPAPDLAGELKPIGSLREALEQTGLAGDDAAAGRAESSVAPDEPWPDVLDPTHPSPLDPASAPDATIPPDPPALPQGWVSGDEPIWTEPPRPVVYDEELLQMLEQLNETLDTANTSLEQNQITAIEPQWQAAIGGGSFSRSSSLRHWAVALTAVALALAVGLGAYMTRSWWLPDVRQAGQQAVGDQARSASGTDRPDRRSTAPDAAITAATGPIEPVQPVRKPESPVAFTVEPARGQAGQPIPLVVTLPANFAAASASIRIEGIPSGARLSVGRSVGYGVWVLGASDAAALTLTVPKDLDRTEVPLRVSVMLADGTSSSARALTVAVVPAPPATAPPVDPEPARAPPDTAPETSPAPRPIPHAQKAQPKPLSAAVEARYLARGNALMRQGDIAGARLILEHAARRGSAGAMFALGRSYDPGHLEGLSTRGIGPDTDQAVAWYRRAAESGNAASVARLKALGRQP